MIKRTNHGAIGMCAILSVKPVRTRQQPQNPAAGRSEATEGVAQGDFASEHAQIDQTLLTAADRQNAIVAVAKVQHVVISTSLCCTSENR